MATFSFVAIIFIAFAGFILSLYIYHKKRRKEHMVCPLKADCQTVIHSQYSRFMGVPVELLGMLYYIGIALGYGLYISGAAFLPWWFGYLLFFVTGMAFLFSGYLTAIQVVTIKNYCTWCLTSAALCTLIFLLSFNTSYSIFVPFLLRYQDVWAALHTLSIGVIVGAWTVTFFFFIRFLRDFRISKKEAQVLDGVSEILWLAFGVVIMSGLGLLLPDLEIGYVEPRLAVESVMVVVLVVVSVILSMSVEPRLINISFGKKHNHKKGELLRDRKRAFILSTMSVVSWYFLFFMTVFEGIQLTFEPLLAIYLAVLACSAMLGAGIEYLIARRARRSDGVHQRAQEKSDS
jgi:uncharacterized membrane protein